MDYNAPYGCSVTTTLKVIGGRWKPVILFHLMENGVCRFNELRRMIDGITQRMLTSQLKELTEDGIIIRVVIESSPPHVEYSLTKYGSTLENILKEMRDWGAQHTEILNNHHSSGL